MSLLRTSCALTTRRALYRVFVSPSITTTTTTTTAVAVGSSLSTPQQLLRGTNEHRRLLATMVPNRRGPGPVRVDDDADKDRGFDRRFTTQKDIDRLGRDRLPRDHEITDPYVDVIGASSSYSSSSSPSGDDAPESTQQRQSTRFVLERLRPGESLRMVQPYLPADPDADRPYPRLALCRVVDTRNEYARQRQLKERKKQAAAAAATAGRAGAGKTKELELTWGIGAHDLGIKMRQMSDFFAKGMRVKLMIARKKRGKEATDEEADDVVRRVREAAAAQGAREDRPAEGQHKRTLHMFFEPKSGK
ncbi:hypothetical protein JDV02_005669 [Purpureocillium takamizusanense]|uniref:Translation initiation factor 3 C-terminal domain-containing protein n=1 Tax=Purpureocillium takamizusanense TaxID=2060973 RepID=A0A9Q8VC54_9HYPO|nr:uncharacterized protein JDV02_005669 [Purpureocillium takamizusanense]UNI19487.1 hypothetical protein JDV02_005669 [Purpureocillium takamizusanense]